MKGDGLNQRMLIIFRFHEMKGGKVTVMFSLHQRRPCRYLTESRN